MLYQDDQFALAHCVLYEFRSLVAQDTVNDLKDENVRILCRKIFLLNVVVTNSLLYF